MTVFYLPDYTPDQSFTLITHLIFSLLPSDGLLPLITPLISILPLITPLISLLPSDGLLHPLITLLISLLPSDQSFTI